MPRRIKSSKLVHTEVWDLGTFKVNVFIHVERRNGARAAFGTKGINIRIPIGTRESEIGKIMAHFKEWALKEAAQQPKLSERYASADYQDGDTVRVGNYNYHLTIIESDKGSHTGNIENGLITLKLSSQDNDVNRSKAIKHLLSRLIAKHQLPVITQRVHDLNERSYQVPVKEVKLKYMSTRWGSCSSNGNINLSTRLLFAPDPVIDYVIVHELAHRLEMNHSPRFWNYVADVIPNYKDHEKWLKTFGVQCDF